MFGSKGGSKSGQQEKNLNCGKIAFFFQGRAREQMLLGGQQSQHQGVAFWFHGVAQGRGFDRKVCEGGVWNFFSFPHPSAFICTLQNIFILMLCCRTCPPLCCSPEQRFRLALHLQPGGILVGATLRRLRKKEDIRGAQQHG